MQGFPKHLNSRHDYEYIRTHFPPEQWKPVWQKLLDNRFIWQNVGELAEGDDGITDATHRVDEETDMMDPEAPVKRMQLKLVENANAMIFRLGVFGEGSGKRTQRLICGGNTNASI